MHLLHSLEQDMEVEEERERESNPFLYITKDPSTLKPEAENTMFSF